MLPHILLCCLTVLAWGHALHRLVSGRAYLDSFVLNFLWSFFNMTGLTTAIRVAWQKPIHRKTERIRIKSPVACRLRYGGKEVPVHLKDLSGCGAGVTAEDALALHAGQKVYLDFDEVRLRCCVVRNNGHELGLEFLNLAPRIHEICDVPVLRKPGVLLQIQRTGRALRAPLPGSLPGPARSARRLTQKAGTSGRPPFHRQTKTAPVQLDRGGLVCFRRSCVSGPYRGFLMAA